MCLLGHIPPALTRYEHVIQTLLMLARKCIMVKWVGDEHPSITLWNSLILEVTTRIKLEGTFESTWSEQQNGRGTTTVDINIIFVLSLFQLRADSAKDVKLLHKLWWMLTSLYYVC